MFNRNRCEYHKTHITHNTLEHEQWLFERGRETNVKAVGHLKAAINLCQHIIYYVKQPAFYDINAIHIFKQFPINVNS